MTYKVRFANPQKQYADHRDEFIKAFDDVLSRGDIVMRKDLTTFEETMASFVGTKYAIGVNSGTSAIYLGLRAAGISPGDEVVTVAHTFIASISIPYLLDATPVLVDVREDFNMDPKLIEKALTSKTKAIEPVHLNGRLCDMEIILDIAKRKGLLVVEDAAQALGAKMRLSNGVWKKAGSFGNAGAFSLYWAKAFGGFGNNGIAVTNDAEIAEKIRLLRYNGEDRETRYFRYHSHNLLMDNLHAALLNVKFQYFEQWLERRKQIAQQYKDGLSSITEIVLPHFNDDRFADIYTNYVIRTKKRDDLKVRLEKDGIETMISWPEPMYKQPVFANKSSALPRLVGINGDTDALSVTETLCREVLSLPMYPELTDDQVQYSISSIRKFFGQSIDS